MFHTYSDWGMFLGGGRRIVAAPPVEQEESSYFLPAATDTLCSGQRNSRRRLAPPFAFVPKTTTGCRSTLRVMLVPHSPQDLGRLKSTEMVVFCEAVAFLLTLPLDMMIQSGS